MCQAKTNCYRFSGNKTKTIPTPGGVHGMIWPLGMGYFHWMAAITLKILARPSGKSIYRLGAVFCWFAYVFDSSRFATICHL